MAYRRGPLPLRPRSLPEQTRRLLAQFSPEDRVLVVIAADPDALASALAFKRLLWRKVASVTIARVNEVSRPDNLAMIRLLDIPVEPLASLRPADYQKHVMLDSQPHHGPELGALCPQVVIDHHPLGERTIARALHGRRPRYGANAHHPDRVPPGGQDQALGPPGHRPGLCIKNDTAGFSRPCLPADVEAFQFVFPRASISVLRKIEFSEMRFRDLDVLRLALERAVWRSHSIYAHLGTVKSPDNLVQIADFFLKVDLVDLSVVSGICQDRLVVILRNAQLRKDAGKLAQQAFGKLGSAGGHRAMARAEIPLSALRECLKAGDETAVARFVIRRLQGRRPKAKPETPAPLAVVPGRS